MKIALASELEIGLLDSTYTQPAANFPLLAHSLRCNNMITSWILNTVATNIRNSIVYMRSTMQFGMIYRLCMHRQMNKNCSVSG